MNARISDNWLSKKVFFLCCFITLLIFPINTNILLRNFFEESNVVQESTSIEKGEPNELHLPLCIEDLLERGHFNYRKWARESYNRLIAESSHAHTCKLLEYTVERAVSCFDNFFQGQLDGHGADLADKKNRGNMLHFVFIGDSRIRQQFFYFLKLIPDYDRMAQPLEIPENVNSFYHGDVDVDSRILGLRISFKWRPIINSTVIDTIRQWRQSESARPDLIFLSMEVHYMLRSNGADFKLYRKSISEIGSVLNQLAKLSIVIWLNQYPTLDFYGNTLDLNTYIHSEKIYHYNEAVHKIWKSYNYVRIWDSSNILAEEYIRGCGTYRRGIPSDIFIKNGANPFINCKSYINCEDYIHTGYVALAEASQLLYNDICNRYMYQEDT